VLLLAGPASAEIVRLTNGRTITVESCRFEGDFVVLLMRGGGEIRTPKGMVAELLPDEIPFARAIAIEALAASPTATAPISAAALHDLVDRIAARIGIDGKLAHAVVKTESNYDPRAISPKGAMGLMQLMPVVARQYSVHDDPFDPEKNLEAGLKHLRGLLQRFDLRRALAAYNAGESTVIRYGTIPPYRETQDYVQRIVRLVQRQP
jgi:soluble lytic murein transglycosylase-like protein